MVLETENYYTQYHIQPNMYQKNYIPVAFSFLLSKLLHNDWLSSYFSGITQSTQIDHTVVSDKESVICGVSPGSVLGPPYS